MKKLSSVVLAAFLFLSTLLFGTPNANAQTTFPLIYGGTYFVQNGHKNLEEGYLDTKGVGSSASTAGTKERTTLGTSHWRFVESTLKIKEEPQSCGPENCNKPVSAAFTYEVKPGDTLFIIAETIYKDGNQWTRILEANKTIIHEPDKLKIGQHLNIPYP
jgi:nucleoid-associated protein YgaU